MPDEIPYWCGKRIDEMSREELIEALATLGRLYQSAINSRKDEIKFTSDVMKAAIHWRAQSR